MQISARNLAGALSVLGADVESVLLEVATVAPALETSVRKELYRHEEAPKLKLVGARGNEGYVLVWRSYDKHTCIMHAADQITRAVDDGMLVQFLLARFPDYKLESLC